MSNYSRGNYAEVRVAAHLRAEGYEVWQARGSKGAADLIAIKPGEVLLVQVKGHPRISGDEWNALRDLAVICGAVPIVALAVPRRALELTRITGFHWKHSADWPGEPFLTDEAAAS